MCGIAGFCNFDIDFIDKSEYWTGVLTEMRKAVAHRGSDNVGELLREHVGLSHTRLSIRDLCNRQPIIEKIDNKEYVICI